MKIKSTVAEATKYSDDALEAFYTAVDNGQARLALLILVDVIQAFEEKLDALTNADAPKAAEEKTTVSEKQEQSAPKQEPKKTEQKQVAAEKDSAEEK